MAGFSAVANGEILDRVQHIGEYEMSYENEEYMFSDNERDCGITGYFSVDGDETIDLSDFADSDVVEPMNITKVETVRILSREATKAVSHLKSVEQIQNKLLKKLIDLNLSVMIRSYSRNEKLPEEHVRAARQPRALPILLKGFFKAHLYSELDVRILDSVETLCEKIYRNDELDIVYDRVSLLQRFVHDLIDEEIGDGQRFSLPVKPMRHLLSAARLHLNIVDFKHQSPQTLLSILKLSKQASDEERVLKRGAISIPRGRRYILNWRVLHLDSIMQYQSIEVGNRLYGLMLISKDQDVQIFRDLAVDIYSGRILPENLPNWIPKSRWSK